MKLVNKISKYVIVAVLSGCLLIAGCKKNDDTTTSNTNPTTPPTAMSARDSAAWDYNTNYLGSAISSAGWTGSATL